MTDEDRSILDGVDWSQQFGAECPACGYYTRRAYSHLPWRDGIKTRYHRCPHCGHNFKSITVDLVSRAKNPDQGQLKYLRDYRGQCSASLL